MPDDRPILVTGGHRSGTGWVGRMLSATPEPRVGYIWEPFNLQARRGMCAVPFPYWFFLVDDSNGDAHRAALADTLAFRYRPLAELRSIRSSKDAGRFVQDWIRTERLRRGRARALMKDPIALFSAEWLADTFGMRVTVLTRHPAAFANSLLRRNWGHPFDHFVLQPRLMEQLSSFADQIHAFAAREQPLLDQTILLWNVINHRVDEYRTRRPGWTFARLEDVSMDPASWFRAEYERLGLRWTEAVHATIERHSAAGNPLESADPTSHVRDSRAAITTWKGQLTREQIRHIRSGTEAVASRFYGDEDW